MHTSAAPLNRALIPVAVTMSTLALFYTLTHYPGHQGDFAVYRSAGIAALDGIPLYQGPMAFDLLFTYTPFAALLFTPFAAMPYETASLLFTGLIVLLLGIALAVIFQSLEMNRRATVLAAIALPATLLLEPVRTTLGFGQINMLLLVLVLLDCLVKTPWWPRGLLVGLAAAIKLTPLAFLLFFLLNRDRRAAVTAGVTFVCCAGIGFLTVPSSALTYWTSAIFDTSRIGKLSFMGNQSLRGLLARPGLGSVAVENVLWALGCVAVLVVTVVAMRRVLAQGRPAQALVLNGFAGLLVSPISWSHHWVWLVPAIVVYLVTGLRTGDGSMVRISVAGALIGIIASIDEISGVFLCLSPFTLYGVVVLTKAAKPLTSRFGWSTTTQVSSSTEDSHSGLVRTTGNRVGD